MTFSPAVVAAIAAHRDTWMPPFVVASSGIAQAICDGSLSPDLVSAFPTEPPLCPKGFAGVVVEAARLAVLSGLRWVDVDQAVWQEDARSDQGPGRVSDVDEGSRSTPGAWRPLAPTADVEDVVTAVEALRGLCRADVGRDGETWSFSYPVEELEPFGLDVEDVREALQGCTIRDAARLIVAADRWGSAAPDSAGSRTAPGPELNP